MSPGASVAEHDAGLDSAVWLSIVVLTYNRRPLLADCLDSLLAQTGTSGTLEILVADDGSSDSTPELAQQYAQRHSYLRYVRQPHRGVAAARNLGIRHARGDVIAIVADDYILEPTYAKTIERFFGEFPDADVVRFKVVAARDDFRSWVSHLYLDTGLQRRALVANRETSGDRAGDGGRLAGDPPPAALATRRRNLEAAGGAAFRRDVFARVGLFDETLVRAEDSEFAARLCRAGIRVHYESRHSIRHQYDPRLRTIFRSCFVTGWYRYRMYAGRALAHESAIPFAQAKLATLAETVRRARQTRSSGAALVALGFMLVFESLNKLGFLTSWLWTARPIWPWPPAGAPHPTKATRRPAAESPSRTNAEHERRVE